MVADVGAAGCSDGGFTTQLHRSPYAGLLILYDVHTKTVRPLPGTVLSAMAPAKLDSWSMDGGVAAGMAAESFLRVT